MEISVNKTRCCVERLRTLLATAGTAGAVCVAPPAAVVDSAVDDRVLLDFLNLKSCTEKDIKTLFTFLTTKLLDPAFTLAVADAFEQYLLLIITAAIPCDKDVGAQNFLDHQIKSVALAKLIHISVDIKRYANTYFRHKPPPFEQPAPIDTGPKQKKVRNEHPLSPLDELTIAKCCYQLLRADPTFYRDLWNWSGLLERFCENTKQINGMAQFYCNHIIAILTNMTVKQLRQLNDNFTQDIWLQFDLEQRLQTLTGAALPLHSDEKDSIVTLKFDCDVVTNIEGVLLPVYNKDNREFYANTDGSYDRIVKVDSTRVNLRSIALGIAAGKAICLSGAVGCGKTTLVEYLARKTGRIRPKAREMEEQKGLRKENIVQNEVARLKSGVGSKRKALLDSEDASEDSISMDNLHGFLRIQLGDQTDSKMLLGQYRCTDVPGEFIWLPGVLTQAVMYGYWLLLEDLDAATQDTYTILSSLLENNCLSIPGFRDSVKIEPGFQLFVTVRTNKSAINAAQKSLFTLLEKYLYTINILPLSRNELCKVVSTNYPKLSTVANRIVDVFLTFSSGDHTSADYLRQQETGDKADTTEKYIALPFEQVSFASTPNSGRLVSTRDLIKLCQRSNPQFSVTSTECAYFVFQNAVDVFCSYLSHGKERTSLITSIGAKLGIIQSRCEFFANEYKPEVTLDSAHIKVGRAELHAKVDSINDIMSTEDKLELQALKRQKLSSFAERDATSRATQTRAVFSFTRMASCLLERVAVCVAHAEPVLLVGETGVGKTSAVQYLAARTKHKLVVVNMNNQSDVSDLVGGFKPVDLSYVVAPMRSEFEFLFRQAFHEGKNANFLNKFAICFNQGNHAVVLTLMLKVVHSVFKKSDAGELKADVLELLPRWEALKTKLLKLNAQLAKSINISFAFIPGSLVNSIKNGDWILLDEINLASAETLECLSTILEPDGSVVLLERGDFTPIKRHRDFRIFACMNPNTDIGKKDLSVGIRNRFTEFFVDELTTDADLSLLVSDYLSSTGIQKKVVTNIVKLYKQLKQLAKLELNDGLGNRPVFSLRTLCRALRICAKNLCGSIERNLYESFCLSFLTQLDPQSHAMVLQLVKQALVSNEKAVLRHPIPKPGEDYLNFEGYWIQQGAKEVQECANYILTDSVRENLKDLARIISIGRLPVLLQGPTSAGKTSLIDYVAKRSGNHCLRINNHEHTDLQEYIGTYTADATGKLSFKEGVLVQAMRNGHWIILDELNLASTEILEALNRVLDDNRELFIPETQTVVKAHTNFMLFATQNPPGLYGGRKTLSRAFKNRFIELHFSDIPRNELETILEKRCLIPASYARKMVLCMSDLQKNRKTTSKNVFTLRDLFRWGNRYTYADKKLLEDKLYDWNQHLIEEGYLVLSAKVRTTIETDIIEQALYNNFKKRVDLARLYDARADGQSSPVTRDIIASIQAYKQRTDIVWTRNMTRMAVLTAKALQFDEPVLLVGPTGCGKTTVCQILASIKGVQLRILNCHMHTEGADFLGGLRPCRQSNEDVEAAGSAKQLFEWADGPLIYAMQEGSYFMADEISLAEDSVLERLNCILEPERTVLLAEKGGVDEGLQNFVVQATAGFQFLATMNPGGDFGKKELSPALRNRFTEIWCLPSDSREDLIQIACNSLMDNALHALTREIATYIVDIVLYIRDHVEKFRFSIRDILAWINYFVQNKELSFPEKAIFGLETIFLDALEMLPHESLAKVEAVKADVIAFAIKHAAEILNERFSLDDVEAKRGDVVEQQEGLFGIKPFYIESLSIGEAQSDFLFEAPTTKRNLFRLVSALSLKKPVLLEGPPGVGKTSIVESVARAIGYQIVRINLCEHTDLADLFGTDLPAEDDDQSKQVGAFVWRDGPLLAALKADNTWILLDELNLAPQSVLEGLNAILDHRGEVYIPELNKTFLLNKQTRIFACQNPLKQGGGRKGLPQSFLNRFNKVYLRKLSTEDLLYVVNGKYGAHFAELQRKFQASLEADRECSNLFDLHRGLVRKTVKIFDLADRLVQFSELLDTGISTMEFGYKGGPYEINLRDILRWCDLLVNAETGFIFQKQLDFAKNFENFLLTLYERMKLVYYQRMRCEPDKRFIRNAYAKVFACDAEQLNLLSEDVALYWTADKLYLNDIVLQRTTEQQSLRPYKAPELAPLLLGSQRETLKHIIECVHMEKPVLLCGPTDTGKTKLVDALCSLSNNVCNTDTIDDSVTGSFQQIDLNRHIEAISQAVESIFLTYTQHSILASGLTTYIIGLLKLWGDYNMLSKSKPVANSTSSMAEELQVFRRRLQFLKNLIEKLQSSPAVPSCSENLSVSLRAQLRILTTLQSRLLHAESLNTGGSFEWVDSKIVKSLKTGQFILLEHVNLCSSAVLDRLNPVFEPNGSLLISEKGVTANDTAELVEKSPHFRAFLTIDPKNGELSRAMRNRCVEIYLPKDAYDEDDKRMIIHTQGVHETAAINAILDIHEKISHLTEINNYNISHLTQLSFLVGSYKRIGYDVQRAIYVSAMEVYVYAASVDLMGYGLEFYQSKLRDLVLEETQRYSAGNQQDDHLVDVMLNLADLNEAALIKLQLTTLNLLIKHKDLPKAQLADLFTAFAGIDFTDIAHEQLIRYYIYMLYETSSFDDAHLRSLFLQKALRSHPQLQELARNFYSTVDEFEKHFENPLQQLPWNSKLLPRIRDYALHPESNSSKAYNLSASLLMKLLLENVPREKIKKANLKSSSSALTYSQAVAARIIPDKLNNNFLTYLAMFVESLHELLQLYLQRASFDMESLVNITLAYLWYNRLLNTAKERLFNGKELNTDLVDKLLLYFKWLDKHLLKLLADILPNYRQLNANLGLSLQILTNHILSVKQPLNLERKVYSKQMSQFQPFYQEEQVAFYMHCQLMDQLLLVVPQYGSYSPDYILKKFTAQKSDSTRKCLAVIKKHMGSKFDYQFRALHLNESHAAALSSELKAALHEFINELNDPESVHSEAIDLDVLRAELANLKQFVDGQNELEEALKSKHLELSMLPLREYYLNKTLVGQLAHLSSNVEINLEYCENLPTLVCTDWQLIDLLRSRKFSAFAKVWVAIMKHVQHSDEFKELLAYLDGSYKNFNTFSSIVQHAVNNLQLNSLAAHTKCTQILRHGVEIDCRYVYEGPSLVNAFVNLLYQSDGNPVPVPLSDLDCWKATLKQMRELYWHNSLLMTPTFDVLRNNLKVAQQNASKLMREIEYVKQLCEDLENENFSDYNEGFQKLVQALSTAQSENPATSLKESALQHQQLQYQASLLSALIGAIELCLLTYIPAIDPVEKNRLKNLYNAEDINCLSTLTTVYDFMRIVLRYKHFGGEIYDALEQKLAYLKVRQQKFAQKVALRPEKCLYSSLVQDVAQFLKTNCAPKYLSALIQSTMQQWTERAVNTETCAELMNKIDLWIANSQRFVNHILKPYNAYYQDFIQPLQCSVDQLRFGLEGMKVVLHQLATCAGQKSTDALHAVLSNIVRFPATASLEIFNSHSPREIAKNRAPIFGVLEQVPGSQYVYSSLLKVKLCELRNLITVSTQLTPQLFFEFDFTLNICNQIWQAEEERRRQKQAEDDSLFINKTRCENEDEALLELQEIAENFPTSVQEDFGDFMQEDTLEQVVKLDQQQLSSRKLTQTITDSDYAYFAQHFIAIMQQFSSSYYYRAGEKRTSSNLELLAQFKARMQVFVKIFAQYKASLNQCLDETVYNCFGLAIGLQQQLLGELSLPEAETKTYNFYKDSSIPEVLTCATLLQRIDERVLAELELYPEHASLLDITAVIQRIRALPATSPVVRFNTGFQILRQKLAQWNEVAHKHNHLRAEEIEVAAYVQKWTKLELQFWRSCLGQTYEKVERQAYKYWFFIYNLLQEYLQEHAMDCSYTDLKYAEQRFVDGEILHETDAKQKTQVSASEIVGILRQFVESARYGDFHIRMQLLQAFELYLHGLSNNTLNAEIAEKQRELIAGLHNLQLYFTQFAQAVAETNTTNRKPIEKKLKELVKIESYNKDLSYFSMRNNVARVHRNLNKFLKEYEKLLQQKVTDVFQPKDATVGDYRYGQTRKDVSHLVDAKWFIAPQLHAKPQPLDIDASPEGTKALIQKVPKLFATSRNIVQATVRNAKFPRLTTALETLFTEQLERCEALRNLNVDRSKERPKQKLEAKQILQQKRKALTDLFKILTELGISYKSGLMELSLRTEFEDLAIPPYCLQTMLKLDKCKPLQAQLLQLNEHVDQYYVKSVFKLRLLQNIMLTPLSELGPPNIERIKGFAVDLFLLVQRQRQLLANTVKDVYELNGLFASIREVAILSAKLEVDVSHLEFSDNAHKFRTLKDSLCHIRYSFEQLQVLLSCVPQAENKENQVLCYDDRPLLQSSPYFESVTQLVANVLQRTRSTLTEISAVDAEFVSYAKLKATTDVYQALETSIEKIKTALKSADSNDCLPLGKSVLEVLAHMAETKAQLATPTALVESDFANVDVELENVLFSILLALQKLYKKYPTATAEPKDDEKPKETDVSDESDLEEHHLKTKLFEELCADCAILNMPSLISKLSAIMLTVKHSRATAEKLKCLRKISAILPILEQYQLMVDYYLLQQLGAHRISAKMLSVILTVFVEISTKGFCVPPDLMQDEEGTAKQQQEGEGMGLEDGTGENDVSDKIESEDQLDDAKRPEDRKQEEQQKQDDCKEEKGIEMSEDFDGEMQDLEKREDEEDDSGDSEDEKDLNKEMGETEEGADKLDDQIWGDDEEPEPEAEEDEKEMSEEQDGKGSKDEKDTHNDLDTKNDGETDEQDKDGLDATNESAENDKRKQQQKDIENMKDPEMDEEQTNEYHNELEEPPEPEEMDLGDMNNVDNEHEEGEEQQDGDNPFDIDAMKDNMQETEQEEGEETTPEEKTTEDPTAESTDSEDDEEGGDGDVKPAEKDQNETEEQKDDATEPEAQKRGEDKAEEENEMEAKDEVQLEQPEAFEPSKDKPSKEEKVESVPELDKKGSADQVQSEQKDEKDVEQQQKMDEQETGEEKDGVGQAEDDMNDGGHQGIADTKETITPEERKNERTSKEKRKQGKTNEERTLGEAEKNKLKQLKTIDKLKEAKEQDDTNEETEEKETEAEEYQHVKEPKKSDKTTLDNATQEQTKQMQHQDDEEMKDKEVEEENTEEDITEMDDDAKNVNEEDDENLEEMSAEKFDQKSEKPSKSQKTRDQVENKEEMEIEGEIVPTITVPRGDETTAHCNKEILLENVTQAQEPSSAETMEMRRLFHEQMTTNKAFLPQHEDYECWQSISHRMLQNACELCEQLRLILEPTKCTRLKGDYRTGRRINMKKIIPYIASQFRKDKIWLRRTKPAQRDYKITIAIDDSKSMHHNNSKTLTLEAISLVSQALTLLESGRLNIVSFGESPQIILNHTEQFDGPKLVGSLNFAQDKTKIAELLDFVRTANAEEGLQASDNGLFENLLLVLSDGRNIFSEGKVKVRNAIKLARLQRIFLVYIIIDNPENKNSILDIQTMETLPDKRINIKSYLDDFPFPYYVIVRDLNQLPMILSEAMRQWFELVNSEQ